MNVCSTEYDPFCCDGTTFSTAYQIRCTGVDAPKLTCKKCICESQTCAACVDVDVDKDCKEGACEEDVYACTHEFTPYCCDEKTHANPFDARCNGHKCINFKCKVGICESDESSKCPQNFETVCCNKGTDKEQEYRNYCEAMCDDDEAVCEVGKCEVDTFAAVVPNRMRIYAQLNVMDSTNRNVKEAQRVKMCTIEYDGNPCLSEAEGVLEPTENQNTCRVDECRKDSGYACTAKRWWNRMKREKGRDDRL
eukprot:259866_1